MDIYELKGIIDGKLMANVITYDTKVCVMKPDENGKPVFADVGLIMVGKERIVILGDQDIDLFKKWVDENKHKYPGGNDGL